MTIRHVVAALVAPCLLSTPSWAASDPTKEPLPLVGTAGHGHAYPGATLPFGMVQLSPDTPMPGWDGCSGYHYTDSVINGFSHTHLAGTGCGCLGDVLLMPTVGDVKLSPGAEGKGYSSRFSHKNETATPGYYRVFLDDPKINVELTATERSGFHKYTFPATDKAHVILDLVHGIGNNVADATLKIESPTTISGTRTSDGWGGRRDVYFVMEFSEPFESFGIEENDKALDATARESHAKKIKAFFNYKTKANESILVKVGISGTGIEGARRNLAAEIPGWSFNHVRAGAVKQWKTVFDGIKVESADVHVRNTFYANLYATCIAPVLFNDVDGRYRGMDHKNHSADFQNYTTFSLWDTYRAEHPLLTLVQPGRVNDMMESMLAEYKENGKHTTPVWPLWGNETWCMIGYHSVDVIADAYFKGLNKFDAETAYQCLRETAMQDRSGLKTYKELGYVASTAGGEATSKTIEYSFDDWCIAKMADSLGHKEDAQLFYKRAGNYRNLFDSSVGFFRGRKASGKWRSPFNPIGLVGDEYTEADAWQYAFGIQQDVPGMISLYGGDQGFINKMDAMYAADSKIETGIPDITGLVGQYAQGDEQCHHVAYLYNYAGVAYKTQKHVREVMKSLFDESPNGQCGNVDCGQMAAWYVFSALGFYPVNPDSGIYIIGSPTVEKAVIQLDKEHYQGHKFTVIAKNNSAQNIYIQSATLNGVPLTRSWISHQEIVAGGTLRLVMGSQPNLTWGSAKADRPPATMPADYKYVELPAPSTTNFVVLPLPIRVICGSDDNAGDFSPDPNMMSGGTGRTRTAVDTTVPNAAPEAVYQAERYGQDFSFSYPVPQDHYLVRLHFAEVFDDGAGTRVENITINGKPALMNFDVVVAAGGKNKALVKDFSDITPDEKGNIVIRVTCADNSPDKNAKISGIEILPAAK